MTANYDKIRDEKLQYDINREAVKISILSSGKADKYKKDEKILPSDQRWVIKQAKFTYYPLGKALEKHKKNNWGSRQKANKSNWRTWKIIKFYWKILKNKKVY